MTTRLQNKTAVVTGGSRGIGRAIVETFAAEGAQVLTCGRGGNPDELPAGVHWITKDVGNAADVDALAAKAVECLGPVDILVNNAGVQIEKTVVESTEQDWDHLMGINAKGVFMMCRRFIPLMTESGGGSIINIGSISGINADPAMALYNASKALVHGLTRSIAVDHGADGIRCNAICPGWITTGMADTAFATANDPQAAKRDGLARHPARRLGKPSDIANTALWLASAESEFATGQLFVIDGGLTAASPLQPGLF